MKFGVSVLLVIAAFCALETYAGDIHFSDLVIGGHVGDMSISVDYSVEEDKDEFMPYAPSCPDESLKKSDATAYNEASERCTDLNYDDGVEVRVSFDASQLEEWEGGLTLERDGDDRLGRPVKFKVMACFANGFTSRRKWRKPKDIVQDDKRCRRELAGKTDLNFGPNNITYKLDSDTPGAQYFVTVFIFCDVDGKDDNQYCFFDTTGPLRNLAKPDDIRKRPGGSNPDRVLSAVSTSTQLQYKTSVPDFRTTGLVVGVIVLSICSVSMLFGYFTFERLLKKTT